MTEELSINKMDYNEPVGHRLILQFLYSNQTVEFLTLITERTFSQRLEELETRM